jgi:ATP-dependent helicase/nuclease subunit A
MIGLEPLMNPPVPDPVACEVIDRFERRYGFAAATARPGALSVTSLAKLTGEEGKPEDWESVALVRKLDLPPFFTAEKTAKATDIGTATHRFLELCDFSGTGSDGEIDRQIESMVSQKLLSPNQAKLIDRGAVAWLFSSDLAPLLKRGKSHVLREIPFAVSLDDSVGDPADRTMVRGRIDLLIRKEDGTVAVVDYKTDRLTPEEISERSRNYQSQMKFYKEALEKAAGTKVSAIHLVFLSPRVIVTL